MPPAEGGRGDETGEQADGDGEIKTREEGKLLKLQTILLKSFLFFVFFIHFDATVALCVIAREREQNEDGNDSIHCALRYFLSC